AITTISLRLRWGTETVGRRLGICFRSLNHQQCTGLAFHCDGAPSSAVHGRSGARRAGNGRSTAPSWYWRPFRRQTPAGPDQTCPALASNAFAPARSCSAARRLFFGSDLVALEEAPHRGATARNFVLAHRQNDLIQRQVRLLLDQTQQKIRMLLQWRDAPAPRLGRAAASLTKALDPDNRCAGADLKLFGYLAPRSSALHLRYHSLPHVPRIG